MADVVGGRSPLLRESAGRRNAERAITVVPEARQAVIEEQRCPLPTDTRALECRQQRSGIDVRIHLHLVLPRGGVRHHFDDIGKRRVGPQAADRRIEIEAARHP